MSRRSRPRRYTFGISVTLLLLCTGASTGTVFQHSYVAPSVRWCTQQGLLNENCICGHDGRFPEKKQPATLSAAAVWYSHTSPGKPEQDAYMERFNSRNEVRRSEGGTLTTRLRRWPRMEKKGAAQLADPTFIKSSPRIGYSREAITLACWHRWPRLR